MSDNSSHPEEQVLNTWVDVLGGPAGAVEVNSEEMAAHRLFGLFRVQLKEAIDTDAVAVGALARRLHVSPSAVSRFLHGDGDLKASTAALFAHVLGREWNVSLDKVPHSAGQHNAPIAPMVTVVELPVEPSGGRAANWSGGMVELG